MSILTRINRHAKLSLRVHDPRERLTPPFLILFINSICNLTCEHCFYWRNLNRRDDLTYEELSKLSVELGNFENLNLSGGEPFIRPEFGDICLLFTENNSVKRIYVPTNGYFTDRTQNQLQRVFQSKSLQSFVCESRWTECRRTMTGFGAIRGHLPRRWKPTTCWRKCRSRSLAFEFMQIPLP